MWRAGERAFAADGGGGGRRGGGGVGRAAAARRAHVASRPEALCAPDAHAAEGGARHRPRVRRAARHLRRARRRDARALPVHRRTRCLPAAQFLYFHTRLLIFLFIADVAC